MTAALSPEAEAERDASTLLLVDLGAIYWQAWHTTNVDDAPDAAVSAVMFRLRAWDAQYAVAVCLDDPTGNWRHDQLPSYKATRSEKPAAAVAQYTRTIELVRREGFTVWDWPSHEADDVIASVAIAAASEGCRVLVATVDKDLMQLVRDPLVSVLNTRTGDVMGEAEVMAKYGVPPRQIGDWLALMGDASDNIPGVHGVGAKRAADLLRHYGTVTRIVQAAGEPAEDHPQIKPAVRAALLEAAETTLPVARRLVALVDVLPISWTDAFAVRTVPTSPTTPEAVEPPTREEAKEEAVREEQKESVMKIGKFSVSERERMPARFVLYGPGGVGKSTLAASAPDSFTVCIEDGMGEIDGLRAKFEPGRVVPRSYGEVMEMLAAIRDGDVGDRKSLVIDGASRLDTLIAAEVCRENKWKSLQDPGFGKGEAEVLAKWNLVMLALDDIRKRHGLRIVITAHEQIINFKNPEGAEYQRYDLALTKHPKGDVAAAIFNWAEVVGFCRHETLTHEVKKRTIALAEEGDRVMHLTRTGAYQAKCRLGVMETIPLTRPDGQPRGWVEVFGDMEDKAPDRLLSQIETALGEADTETATKARAWLATVNRQDVNALARGLENLRKKKTQKDQEGQVAA